MFTKDNKRGAAGRPAEKKPQAKRPDSKEPRRAAEEGRRTGAAEPRKRPAEEERRPAPSEGRRRPPEDGRRAAPSEGRKRPPEEGRRPAPSEGRRRPPEEGRRPALSEGRRRPPEEGRRSAPSDGRKRPPEEGRRPAPSDGRRRPPEEGRRAAPSEGRRRPPEEGRRPAPSEDRKRPDQQPSAGERAGKPEEERVERESSRDNLTAEELLRELNPPVSGETEEGVYQIRQEPRKTPSTSRSAGKKTPEKTRTRKTKPGAVREPPQGTSYRRSTPKQKKTLRDMVIKPGSKYYKDPDQQAAAARARQAAREEQKRKLKQLAAKLDTPAIVYTEPIPFNRNRLLIQLVSVLAVACAFVMALSIFFKVEYITVSGTETYSPYVIQEASGIKVGDNLLTFGRARASGLITANLPYVNSVRIGIKLPNTVNIDVEEADIAYSIKSGDGDWWLITSEGKVVQQIPGSTAKNYTQVLGVLADNPEVGQPVMAVEETPEDTGAAAETKKDDKKDNAQKDGKKEETSKLDVPVTVSGAMRLSAALRILIALEENDIVGDAASVNVENMEKIELWYGQRYQVNLGDAEQLDYKVACMYDAILQMSDYQTGMLDVSFTKKEDQVIYTPFV